MAISAFQSLVNKLFREFTLRMGREPQTPREWMEIQNEAVRHFNRTKGVPSTPKAPPFQGFKPKVIQGGKGIESLLESGAVKKGVAPKTKLSTLEGKKQKLDAAINKEEWIARKHRENKEAVERFEKKFGKKKTVEDFRDEGDWDPSGMASGGLAYMLGEPNTRTEALREFGVVTDPWGMYTDPSLYAQGERSSGVPGRAEYKEGGVGHGPWTMNQGARTPEQPEQNLDTPQPQVMGTPNPLQMPQGIPSAAPKSMDPRVMQQQMQHAMMQQMMGQQPRMGYAGGGMTRRAFMKLMSGLAALPFIGKGIQKTAPKVIPKVTETVIERGADGIPKYAFDLIEVVKAKGTKEIMEGIYKRSPPSTKHTYKGVEVVEDGTGGVSVRKEQEKMGRWEYGEDDVLVEPYVDREIGFEIRKGEDIVDEGLETQKAIKGSDEYNESTAYMQGDPEGGIDVSDVVEVITEADHADLKKIADEVKDLPIRTKKASGGLAYMLGA